MVYWLSVTPIFRSVGVGSIRIPVVHRWISPHECMPYTMHVLSKGDGKQREKIGLSIHEQTFQDKCMCMKRSFQGIGSPSVTRPFSEPQPQDKGGIA